MATQTTIELVSSSHQQHTDDAPFSKPPNATAFNDPGQSLVAEQPIAAEISQPTVPEPSVLPTGRAATVVIQLAGLNFITSFTHGLLTVGVPAIASSLHLNESLYAWPISVFALSCGSALLLAGSVADVLGARKCNLIGAFFLSVFTLACGLARTGVQLVVFRAMQGLASALAVPSALSIVSTSVRRGQLRNVGFATLGFARDLGFSAGLVLGGVFVASIGWRAAFYIGGSVCFLLFLIGIWALPNGVEVEETSPKWSRLAKEVDWIGVVSSSGSLALLSYVLALLSSKATNIKQASNIALLAVSAALAVFFVYWQRRQERQHKPALIPNSLWKRKAFTSACVMVLIAMGATTSVELFSSLFFQEVQGLSALQASIRILPNVLVGVALNIVTGLFIDRVPAVYVAIGSAGLAAIAPLLMAIIKPRQSYWLNAFWAQALSPVSIGVLFTVGILICSSSFTPRTQALAGAVFNTMSQVGTSLGLTLTSVVASSVTDESDYENKSSPRALMEGYRATFWLMFGMMVVVCPIGFLGLRKSGRVGQKRDA